VAAACGDGTRGCFPRRRASGTRYRLVGAPDSPLREHNSCHTDVCRNCVHPHPCGFRTAAGCLVDTSAPVATPRTALGLSLVLPLPDGGEDLGAPCPPGSGGSRPRRRSLRSLASHNGGVAPARLLPRPLRRGGREGKEFPTSPPLFVAD
jgi:hypothetical protein